MTKFKFTVPKPKFDNSAWKVKDPAWLAQREKDFESVALNYKLNNTFQETTHGGLDKELRSLRNYFVLGKLGSGMHARPKSLVYHPEPSSDLIENWVRTELWKESMGWRYSDIVFLMMTNHTTEYGTTGGNEDKILDISLLGAKEYTEEMVDVGGKLEYKMPFLKGKDLLDDFVKKYTLNWLKALSEPKTNPRSILPNLLPVFFTMLHHRGQELAKIIASIPAPYYKDPEKKIRYLADGLYVLFTAIHHFYEPHVLPEEKSIVKPWVEECKRCYDKYGLPEPYEALWQKAKDETESEWLEAPLLPEVKELFPPKAHFEDIYRTSVIHGQKVSRSLFEKVIDEFKYLNVTETNFSPLDVQLASITRQLHPEMAKRLGYNNGEDVPGYVFRLVATPGYIATTKIQFAIDLVMPIPKGGVTDDTPSLLIIERPDKQYRLDRNRRYVLQRRIVEKAIRERAGLNILRYKAFTERYAIPPEGPVDCAVYYEEMLEPFYDALYYPLVTSRWALVDTEEYAFKDWDKGGYPCFADFVNSIQ